jgi:hypothetical protein
LNSVEDTSQVLSVVIWIFPLPWIHDNFLTKVRRLIQPSVIEVTQFSSDRCITELSGSISLVPETPLNAKQSNKCYSRLAATLVFTILIGWLPRTLLRSRLRRSLSVDMINTQFRLESSFGTACLELTNHNLSKTKL